jgi:hypothetical protein
MAKTNSSGLRTGLVLLIIVIIGGVFFYLSRLKQEAPQVTTNVEDVQIDGVGASPDKKPFSGLSTLMSLQAMQKDLECQIAYSKEGEKDVEGTYFISGGKMRGDFLVPAEEYAEDIVSSLILDGQTLYVWSKIGEDTFGFVSNRASEKPVKSNEPVPLDTDIRYTCTEWIGVDGSVFVPPSSVEFKDLNAVMNAGMEYGTPE